MSIVNSPAAREVAILISISIGVALGGCVRPRASQVAASGFPVSSAGLGVAPSHFTEDQLAVAAASMRADKIRMDVCITNCANMQTPGFKARKPLCESWGWHEQSPDCTIMLDIEQGAVISSSSPLDLAIMGEGWFQVLTRDGTLGYTRDGRFTRNADHEVITLAGGYRLLPTVTIPPELGRVQVQPDGLILAFSDAFSESTVLGRIQLATFAAAEFLRPVDGSLYAETARSGPAKIGLPGEAHRGELLSRFYENSNVDPFAQRMQMEHIRTAQSIWYGMPIADSVWVPTGSDFSAARADIAPAETR